MGVTYAYSSKPTAQEAVEEIKETLANAELVVFFASSKLEGISSELYSAVPCKEMIGCTTAGEIVSGQMLENSVVAMAFDAESAGEVKAAVVENLSGGHTFEEVKHAFQVHFHEDMRNMSIQDYLGLVLVDGLSGAEEKLMEMLSDATDVLFVGGSAGDDLAFKQTKVFHSGNEYSDAAVLLLARTGKGFRIGKTQSFEDTSKRLIATEVDEATRTVHKFNDKPAAEAYAEQIGVATDELANYFMKYPLGMKINDEPYIRSPQKVDGDSVVFYCAIKKRMEYVIFEAKDVVTETRSEIARMQEQLGDVEAILNFNCILRTLQLKNEGKTEDYGRLFADIPTIGFSTYGEQYLGHVNQTATLVFFKK